MCDLHNSYTPPRSCKPYNPTKCEMGDLAGKHGNLTIAERARSHRFYFVDEQLALTSNLTILAR